MKNLEIDLSKYDLDVGGCERLAKAIQQDLQYVNISYSYYAHIDERQYEKKKRLEVMSKKKEKIRNLLLKISFIKHSNFLNIWADASDNQYNPEIMRQALLKINTKPLSLYDKSLVNYVKKSLLSEINQQE